MSSQQMPKYLKDRIRHNGHREAKPLAGRMLLSDGMRSGIDPPEELEHDVLLRGRVHWAYAPAGVGKSWLSLWLTKRCLERGEKVIYFDSENGHRVISERLLDLGAAPDTIDDLLYYYPFPHLERDSVEDYAALLDEVEPALVVFDSLVNFLGSAGLEENSNDVVKWCTAFTRPARERDIAALVLDHTPHEGDHARGASRKRDEADVMWAVRSPIPFDCDCVGTLVLRRDKDREAWLPERVGFSVGGGEDGFVFRRSEGTIEQPDPESGLTPTERRTLEALRDDFGERWATAKEWRLAAKSRGVSERSFWRAKRTVTPPKMKGLVEVENGSSVSAVFRAITKTDGSGESREDKPKKRGLPSLPKDCHGSADSTPTDTATPLYRGVSVSATATDSSDTEAVLELLSQPPPWLQEHLRRYAREPERIRESVCTAIAAKAWKAPGRWQEVVPILTGSG